MYATIIAGQSANRALADGKFKTIFSQTMVFTCDKALYHNWATKPARHFTDPSSHTFATRSQSASKAAMLASVSG